MLIILIYISLTTEEKIAKVTITLKSFVKKVDASLSLIKSGETTKHLSIKTKISDISINDQASFKEELTREEVTDTIRDISYMKGTAATYDTKYKL